MLVVFSLREERLAENLLALAKEKLTKKQKLILCYLKKDGNKTNVTRLVPELSKQMNCSASAVWNNLNLLKKVGLISCGSLKSKGTPVGLTEIGKLISDGLWMI